MYMLGYDVDFGHMEAVNLISSAKYSEKSVGYAWCALMLHMHICRGEVAENSC